MKQTLKPAVETVLQAHIFPDLLLGRKNFDLPHTKAVVYWMQQILNNTQTVLDSQVLLTAAYAHDWGYIGLFDGVDSTDIAVIHQMKPLHMDRGSKKIKSLIVEHLSNFFTTQQIQQVAHLVRVHDKIEELQTEEEICLMEADTLGMLDVSRVKPTFSKIDNDIFLSRELHGRRLPKFSHPFALTIATELAEKRRLFYETPALI